MRRHELELVIALAEGALDDETEARALIESSDRLRAEYEAHKTAIGAIGALPPVRLTEPERAALRRDIWTELRTRPGPSVATPAPGLLRWSASAAAVLVVAATAVVLSQVTVSESTGEELAAVTSAPADERGGALAQQPEGPAVQDTGDAEVAEAVPEPSSSVDTAVLSELADRIRAGEEYAAFSATRQDSTETDGQTSCLSLAGIADHHVVGEYQTTEGPVYLVTAPTDPVDDDTPISFVDAATCELIFTDG